MEEKTMKIKENKKQPYKVPYTDVYGNEYMLIPELRLYKAYDVLTEETVPVLPFN